MDLSEVLSDSFDRPLIARDSLARDQWEHVIAAAEADTLGSSWISRPLLSFSEWLAERWDLAVDRGLVTRNRYRLSRYQSEKLWQRVIDESDAAASLIQTAGMASAARLTRQSLLEAGVDPTALQASKWQGDGSAFLEWHQRFVDYLDQNDWIDSEALLFRLNRLPVATIGQDLCLLAPQRWSKVQADLIAQWRKNGRSIDHLEPALTGGGASLTALTVADPTNELYLAADWACSRLRARPAARLALVVPDLESRRHEVGTVLGDIAGESLVDVAGTRLCDLPIFGAALDGLRLLCGDGGFEGLSRWLRSPFFASEDQARQRQAALLERALRSDPRAQMRFAESWKRSGLRRPFARHLPDTAKRIDASLDRLPRRASPTAWTEAWQSCLRTLGWLGLELALPARQQRAWDGIWRSFAELTPIVGTLTEAAALELLEEIAVSSSVYEPLRDQSVALLTRLDQLGPGFDGIWITGVSGDALPESVADIPLVPWTLRAAHGLPGTDPAHELELARQTLERLRQQAAEVTASCPLRIQDQPQTPSPLISGWQAADRDPRSPNHQRQQVRVWEQASDAAPPLNGRSIPGGIRTLALQAVCPVKAFCLARLDAEPLESVVRGIDPSLRGIVLHRVLEALLSPDARGRPQDGVDDAIESALAASLGPGDARWNALIQAERLRIRQLVDAFLDDEAERPAFTTVGVEQRIEIKIADFAVNGRIDRIDRLAPDATLLIDYKTGQAPTGRWFDDRLKDCQLPAYAVAADAAAILSIRFGRDRIEYKGAGRAEFAPYGRFESFDGDAWDKQLSRWRGQLAELVSEFARGDVRMPPAIGGAIATDGSASAGGAYAALTRTGDPE